MRLAMLVQFLLFCSHVFLSTAFRMARVQTRISRSQFSLQSETIKDKKTSVTPFETFARTFKGSIDKQTLKEKIYLLSAKTARGARATEQEKDAANRFVCSHL